MACLVPPLWRPGGPWDDLGTFGSTTKDTLRSRLSFLLILSKLRDVFSRLLFLMLRGSGSGCLGMESQAFGMRRIAASSLAELGLLMIPASTSHDVGWP